MALNGMAEAGTETLKEGLGAAASFAGEPAVLVIGILLIVGAVAIFFFLKKIIANTIAGLVVLAIIYFVFKISLPLLPTLAVTVVFGLAGIGSMLVLHFLGLV